MSRLAALRPRACSRLKRGLLAFIGVVVAIAAVPAGSASGAPGGRFFTLGFEGSDATFAILVNERDAIRQLRADLDRPRRERRIVSGIVRPRREYNPAWSYTMGPRSIELGEAFIEVCDASPEHVESNRADWLGERWCPWSSYVQRAGR